jgi:hypothetical protein
VKRKKDLEKQEEEEESHRSHKKVGERTAIQ